MSVVRCFFWSELFAMWPHYVIANFILKRSRQAAIWFCSVHLRDRKTFESNSIRNTSSLWICRLFAARAALLVRNKRSIGIRWTEKRYVSDRYYRELLFNVMRTYRHPWLSIHFGWVSISLKRALKARIVYASCFAAERPLSSVSKIRTFSKISTCVRCTLRKSTLSRAHSDATNLHWNKREQVAVS